MRAGLVLGLMVSASTLMVVSGCSLFDGDDSKAPLPGERISVLELQKALETPAVSTKTAQGVVVGAPVSTDTWPMTGANAQHVMPHAALKIDGLEKAWSVDIGSGGDDDVPLTAQPVLAHNMIYTLDTSAQVSAFDAISGQEIWRNSIQPGEEDEAILGGGLAAGSDALYATNGYAELLALNLKEGGIFWRVKLAAPTRSAPTVMGLNVYVLTQDNRLNAFDARSGQKLWDYEGVSEAASLVGGASPAANDQIVVAPLSSGELTALHIENGAVIWSDTLSPRLQTGSAATLPDIAGHPVIDGGQVVALSYGGKIVCLDTISGARIWERDIGGAKTPLVSGNTIFFVTANNELVALSHTDGALLWVSDLTAYTQDDDTPANSLLWNGPILAGGALVLTTQDEEVLFISPRDGSVLKRVSLGARAAVSPLAAQGTLYILGDDGALSAWR